MDQELERQKATIVSFGSTLHDDHVAPTQPPPPPPPQQTPASPQQEARTTSRSSSSTSLNQSQASIESTVTQLLSSTKNILQVLTGWSNQTASAEQVMEVYRTLQEDFDHARQAFASMHVSIDEAAHVPTELHACLEAALAGPPSTATLEQHLPAIRETILQLLHALKQKQAQLRHEVPQRLPRRAGTIRSNNPAGGERPLLSSSASDFDMDDPSTREALTALKQQDDLAHRSSVRRTAQQQQHHHDYQKEADLEGAAAAAATTTTSDQSITSSPSPSPSIAPPPRRHPVTRNQHHDVGLSDSNKQKTLGDKHSNGDPSNANRFYLGDNSIVIYLQIHDRIKKAKIQQNDHQQQPMTMDMLRQLFLDKFDDSMVPDTRIIHIRDPTSGIFYELEDIQDVVPHCLLLLQPSKEDIGQQPPGWYQLMMDKLETIQKALQNGSDNENTSVDMATTIKKKHNPTMTASNVDHRMLQHHQGAIQELRQDLGILRQIASEFQCETKAMLDEMRGKADEYCNKQRQVLLGGQTSPSPGDTNAKGVCGEGDQHRRHYLQETKDRSESTATHITTRLQDLQDTIDQLKLDVTQRRCRPSTAQLEHCEQEVADLDKEIDAFCQLLKKAKPIWKLVWEQELQNVVQEQQFLKEQEALVLDLRDDHADLVQVLKQLQKVHEIQTRQRGEGNASSSSSVRTMFPALSIGGDGSNNNNSSSSSIHYGGGEPGDMASVLKQVTTIDVDHTKRVKAMEQAEKMRARELANRIDDFEKELTAFVDAKKLKRTGGAEQVDRQRKRKDEQLLKALYSNSNKGI